MDKLALEQTLSELKDKQEIILARLEGKKAPDKDGWDKIQCIAPVISGLLIGGFGAFIGYSYNQQQIKLQEAETIERFIPHLAGNEKTKKAAILAMSSLTNTALAAKMASLFASEGTVSALQSIAQTGSTKDRSVATEALANAFNTMAQRSLDEKNLEQAEEYLRKAISIKEKLNGPDSPELCSSLDCLADLYISQGRLALAEPLLRRTVALRQKSDGPDGEETRQAVKRLAALLDDRGEAVEASQLRKMAGRNSDAAIADETAQGKSLHAEHARADDEAGQTPAEEPAKEKQDAPAAPAGDTRAGAGEPDAPARADGVQKLKAGGESVKSEQHDPATGTHQTAKHD